MKLFFESFMGVNDVRIYPSAKARNNITVQSVFCEKKIVIVLGPRIMSSLSGSEE